MSYFAYDNMLEVKPEDLNQLLLSFSSGVRTHRYRLVKYDVWTKLKMLTHDSFPIVFDFDDKNAFFIVDRDSSLVFEYCDDSFGSFIVDHYGDLKKMVSKPEKTAAPVEKKTNKKRVEEEKKDMANTLKFDFGPCKGDNVKMSMYGLALRNTAGTWVSYDKASGDIIDVDIFNFDGSNVMFKIPAALSEVKSGDIVVHNKVPMFVTFVKGNKLTAVDVRAGEEKTIIPAKNMFGFDFITKIVSIFDAIQGAPTPNEPFGNMLPFLMLQDGKMDKNMALMLMMSQGNKGFTSNPMMMYAMMSDGVDSDMLPLMLMMNGGFAAPAAPKMPEA